jgi:hypothetical protein
VIGGKVRIEGHIENTNILGIRRHQGRNARDRRREHTPGIQDADAARESFGEQNLTVRQEGEAPRRGKGVNQRGDLERLRGVIRRAVCCGNVGWSSFFSGWRLSTGWPSTRAGNALSLGACDLAAGAAAPIEPDVPDVWASIAAAKIPMKTIALSR